MREADFSGSLFTGGYLEKAVAFRANFAGMERSKKSAAIFVLAAKISVGMTFTSLQLHPF